MLEGAFSPMHWLVVLAIALIFFGPKKLPELGKGLGTAIRGFKDALNAKDEEPPKDEPADRKESKTPGA